MTTTSIGSQLAPPDRLAPSLSGLNKASESFHTLIRQFGAPGTIEQVPPAIQHLFLQAYQPCARFMGAQGQQLIYGITDVASEIINLGLDIQQLCKFIGDHLGDRDSKNSGLLHWIESEGTKFFVRHHTASSLEAAHSATQRVVEKSGTLRNAIETYHGELNRFVAAINRELSDLAQGPQFIRNEDKPIFAQLSRMGDGEVNTWRWHTLVRDTWHLIAQAEVEQSDYFRYFLHKRIVAVLGEYEHQARALGEAVSDMATEWNTFRDDLSAVLDDVKRVDAEFPQSIAIVTKIDLQLLANKWSDIDTRAGTLT